jgi:PLD-like domain
MRHAVGWIRDTVDLPDLAGKGDDVCGVSDEFERGRLFRLSMTAVKVPSALTLRANRCSAVPEHPQVRRPERVAQQRRCLLSACSRRSRAPKSPLRSKPTSTGQARSDVCSPALAEQAKAGRHVKILLDAIGSASIGPEILDVLEAGGCQVAWYNPIRWYTLGRINNRTHRKSLIVDGRVAFTGGAGIADH